MWDCDDVRVHSGNNWFPFSPLAALDWLDEFDASTAVLQVSSIHSDEEKPMGEVLMDQLLFNFAWFCRKVLDNFVWLKYKICNHNKEQSAYPVMCINLTNHTEAFQWHKVNKKIHCHRWVAFHCDSKYINTCTTSDQLYISWLCGFLIEIWTPTYY